METTNAKRKKRILYFVPEFPRLTETFIEREISKLVEFGNLDIRVFSLQKASGAMSEAVSKITEYKRLDFVSILTSLFYIFTNYKGVAEAFKIVKMDMTKPFYKRIYLFLKALGYAKFFEKYKPDHIHVHFLSDPSTIALVASKVLSVPFSISAHARDVFVDGTLIKQKVENATFVSICNGYAWKKCIELAGLDISSEVTSKKVLKIYHGLDADKLFFGEPKMKKPPHPLIFVGSRLVEKKGLKFAIEAAKLLKDRGIAYEMYIVGPGPMYAELVEMVKRLGLENNVFIPGEGRGIPNAEVMEYFKVADIFAHPSIETGNGDVDGIPTYVIEAALAKLPIVTTKAGAMTDLINEENGVLIPQKDSYELANALEKLIYDSELRKKLGENVYKKAREMFDINKNVGALEKLFLEN